MSSEKDTRIAALEALLKVEKLEQAVAEAKDADADNVRDLKHQLREARQAFRESHRHVLSGGPGDGVAAPDPIRGSISVKGA